MQNVVKFLTASLLLVAFCATAVAASNKAKLVELKVEGNRSVDENLIKLQSGLSVGSTITAEDIQNSIRTLWELNMFSDIQVILDREIGENVYLTIRVEEYPRLSDVEFHGNKKLKKKDLDKKLDYYPGLKVSPAMVSRWERSLRDLYKDKGYLLAEINPAVQPSVTDTNRVTIRFDIREGSKVQVEKITFHGNSAFKDGKLRKQMKKTKEDTWLRSADFDPEKYEEDKDLVVEFYRSKGYRDAEVLRDSLYYSEDKTDLFIEIWVNEGRKYYFGDISFDGQTIFKEEFLRQIIGFREGDEYSSKKLQESVTEKLSTLYWDAGYIWAGINPKETLAGEDSIDITFLINEGRAAKVNKINIVGNTRTKDKVIRRELFIRPGQTFSRELLVRSARELWVLNYFSNVNPTPIPVDTANIDILLEVEEKSTDTANMSAGWSERDKIIGSIGVAMNNLFGGGQKLAFDWNFGRYFRQFQINFTEPWLLDTPTLAGFSLYDTKRDSRYVGFKQVSRGGSFRVGRRLSWPDNFFRGDWIYRIDHTRLSDPIDDVFAELIQGRQDVRTASITQIFSRNSLNRAEFPTAGSSFSLSTEFASSILGGSVNYNKHQFKAEWYAPLLGSIVVRSNFETGLINPVGSTGQFDIPYFERFFMGGEGLTRSIPLRGYDDPLSGRTIASNREGGLVMMKYSMELRLPISPNPTIYALTFAEAGNTWPTLADTDLMNLRRSVGIGARLFMPLLGMLGFDYAYGFDNIDDVVTGKRVGRWKPHFVFGRSF